ncbi:MAG TPA: signal peptidase I [Dehalococcoidales bacterium]|nr:signal peptidase I [Dehalococcoidales bacterium]
MKRAIVMGILIVICIAGFLVLKGKLPFMPIYGSSMEPTLHSGALMVINPVNPARIKIGDIIVYNVPKSIQDYYGYPSVVSHRVIKINTSPSLSYRTKGDNTGEDPFTILPHDIRGTVGKQIPYLGLPLLFMQSKQGMIFVIIGLALLGIFLYGGDLLRGGTFVHRGLFNPVIAEEKRTSRLLTRKIEANEKKMDSTEAALEKFSVAIADYAQNLASHTSAVKSLAEASHELKQGAAEQNRVLITLMQNMSKSDVPLEVPGVPPAPEIKEVKTPPRYKFLHKVEPPKFRAHHKTVLPEPLSVETIKIVQKTTPGCVRSRESLAREALAAQKEISDAVEWLHKKLEKPGN